MWFSVEVKHLNFEPHFLENRQVTKPECQPFSSHLFKKTK